MRIRVDQLLSAKADSLLREDLLLSASGWLTAAQHHPSLLGWHDSRYLEMQRS